jgi:hypothetical protein
MERSAIMTSTRDPREPTLVTTDPAASDDTAGFAGINTTRSNIKNSSAVVVPPIGLGGGLTPSLELPSLGENDVAGFEATDAPASEQPADGTAEADDTAGFTDPIPGVDMKLGKNPGSSAALGGGLPPSFGLAAPGGSVAGGLVPGGAILS